MTLDDLPRRSDRNVAVRATPDAVRQLRGGSPWLYESSITSVSHDAAPGDLAVVFDRERKFCAVGLWDPDSVIRVKILHQGSPVTIDRAFLAGRLASAVGRRSGLLADPETTGLRLVHGENDALPGLVVDVYATTAVVKVYSAAWFPHLATVVDELRTAAGVFDLDIDRVVLRMSRLVAAGTTHGLSDGDVVVGDPPSGPVSFREHGLTLSADVVHGQKTGHFLDQRDNRHRVGQRSSGRRVLDVFASTGGFSLAAAAGGAASVHMVDLSAPAITTARANLAANDERAAVAACSVTSTVGDAFEVLAEGARRGERYDLVVVDPPSFAPRRDAIDGAIRAYQRLTYLALDVLVSGGTLVQCSCSSRVSDDEFTAAVLDAATHAGRPLTDVERHGHAIDHPVGFEFGSYLHAVFARA